LINHISLLPIKKAPSGTAPATPLPSIAPSVYGKEWGMTRWGGTENPFSIELLDKLGKDWCQRQKIELNKVYLK
jgi:hypothetical protein